MWTVFVMTSFQHRIRYFYLLAGLAGFPLSAKAKAISGGLGLVCSELTPFLADPP
jgi:hypothetical protein